MHRFILVSAVIGIIASCGESKPPASPAAAPASPTAESSPPVAESGLPVAEPEPPAAASVPAPAEQPKNLAARKLDPERIKRGEATYTKNCASCHGPNGEATPGWRVPAADGRYPPPPLDGSAHAWHHSTETLETMIRDGSPGAGMPAWNGKLTNQEIDDVIVWIKSLWPDEVYDIWYKEIEVKPEPKRS
ncbi:cytochrome c [Nitrosospira sp. Nsp1]|uniref:c-type cytochrome n=1 Tax=Nitrosospira sp. Nsp1 TaxID=136547 RepID=UPI00210DC934|nr:cytochrome c [Nitrosospira sp. Nsp1]